MYKDDAGNVYPGTPRTDVNPETGRPWIVIPDQPDITPSLQPGWSVIASPEPGNGSTYTQGYQWLRDPFGQIYMPNSGDPNNNSRAQFINGTSYEPYADVLKAAAASNKGWYNDALPALTLGGLAGGVGALSGGFGLGNVLSNFGSGASNALSGGGSSMLDLFDPSTFVDNWDVMGNSSAYGLNGADAAWGVNPQSDWINGSGLSPTQLYGVENPGADGGIWGGLNPSAVSVGADGMPYLNMANSGASLLSRLFGGGGGGGGGSDNAISRLFGGGSGSSGGGSLLSTIPALAAIAYAKGQDPYDLTKLNQAYSNVSPDALALPYDLQTATGRTALTSSLTDRGVMGSSFGNFDLNSYNTLRDVGRQNLLSTGASTQANIASQILNAQIAQQKNKNDLYGRALLAMSGSLAPKNSILDLLGGQ